MADFKKLKDGQGNSYNVKDETARNNIASHISNTSNPHSVTKAQVGLGNVDNTSDANKPISNAQATINAAKFDKANVKSSPGSTPSDDNVLSEKYSEDHYTKHNTYDGTLSVKKADYSDLANNLDSNLIMVDKTPYLYRTSGGALEIANTNRVKKIIGGSLPIIQLVKNGDISTNTNWNSSSGSLTLDTTNKILKFTATSRYGGFFQTLTFTKGHKYLISFKHKGITGAYSIYSSADGVSFNPSMSNINDTSFVIYSKIVDYTGNGGTLNLIFQDNRESDWTEQQFKDFNVIDLTQTFGTTVANRLYALEQAQAGSGIAKAKEILVKDYYPYNVSTFTHVKTTGKVNTGFNQFDLSALLTEIGDPLTAVTNLHLNTKILWTNDCNYQGRVCVYKNGFVLNSGSLGSVYIIFHYTDGTQSVDYATFGLQQNNYIKSSENKIVDKIYLTYSNTGSYNCTNAKMCVSLSWDGERDGEYEDYQEWLYPTEDIELKGIISLNASDEWVYDGDEYNYDGVVENNYKEITISSGTTISRNVYNEVYYFSIYLSDCISLQSISDVKLPSCTKYQAVVPQYITSNLPDKSILYNVGGSGVIIRDDSIESVEAFHTANDGMKIVYKLKDSTTTSADPFQEQQNLSNWGTEKWADDREVPLPVASYTEYLPDLKAKLEVVPESPSEDGTYVMVRSDGQNAYGLLSSYLSDNGYVKVEDLSSSVTLATGVTATLKKAYKHGNVMTMSLVLQNTSGAELSSYATLFTLASGMFPVNQYIVAYVEANNLLKRFRINPSGEGGIEYALPNSSVVYINISYAVA